jgi:hypothetical protein
MLYFLYYKKDIKREMSNSAIAVNNTTTTTNNTNTNANMASSTISSGIV